MMAFSGPSGGVGAGVRDRYERALQLAQDAEEGRVLGRSGGTSRIDTSLLDLQEQREAERQRLLMTPGVRRGGSTATRAQSDSPLNVGTSERFERHGETFSYDPFAAAEEVGSTEATRAMAADRTRFEALKKMPGFSEREASRIVFGRGQPLDTEQARRALGAFVRRPSRDAAALAIEEGASPYSPAFTGGLDMALGERARPTVRGSEEDLERIREEEAIREARARRMAELQASLRPEPRDRYNLVREKGTGRMLRVNMETMEVEPTDAVTDVPNSARARGAGAAFMNGGEQPAATAPAAPRASTPARPEDRFMRPSPAEPRPPGSGMAEIEAEAISQLQAQGIENPTPAQMTAMKNLVARKMQQARARGGR